MFVVKGISSHMVIGGVIIVSVLSVLFPKSIGLVYGLFIGIIVMFIEQLGLMVSNWGRGFGGWVGNWAIGLGERLGDWAIGFSEAVSRLNLLRPIQLFGVAVMIVAGLAIISIILNNYNRIDKSARSTIQD
jgi:hypothetical protein